MAQNLIRRIGEGCACKRNPVLPYRAAFAEVTRNPHARPGCEFDVREEKHMSANDR